MKNAFIRNKRNYKRVKSSMSYQFNLSKREPRFSYGHLDKSLQKYESLNQENNNKINKEKRIDFNFSKIHLDVINILDKCQNEDDDKSLKIVILIQVIEIKKYENQILENLNQKNI